MFLNKAALFVVQPTRRQPPWRISLPDLLALQNVLDEVGNIFACPSFLIYSLDFLEWNKRDDLQDSCDLN